MISARKFCFFAKMTFSFYSPLQKRLMVDQCATEPSIVLPQVQISQTSVVDELESNTLAADRGERYLSSPRNYRSESGVLGGYHSRIIALSFKLLKPDFLGFYFYQEQRPYPDSNQRSGHNFSGRLQVYYKKM